MSVTDLICIKVYNHTLMKYALWTEKLREGKRVTDSENWEGGRVTDSKLC